MSLVGSFPGLNQPRTIIARMPVNEFDKTTIVSILPKEIVEIKPTISPGKFVIPKPKEGGFSLLTIGSSSWFKEMEEGQPFLEIQCNSLQVAEAIINDYINGLFACDMHECKPGLFFVPGEWSTTTIVNYERLDKKTGKPIETFADKLELAKKWQKNWFEQLVREADILWARTNGNPIAIPDDARLAAQTLGLQKTWIQDFQAVQLTNCPACGEMINPNYPVCKNCHAIVNEKAAKEANIKFAS